jgi:hypothetical protein
LLHGRNDGFDPERKGLSKSRRCKRFAIAVTIVLASRLYRMQNFLTDKSVRAPDTLRMTARAALIDSDFRHSAMIENLCSEIDRL